MMDTNVREVITLQVGHYANFVGTHWWNLQEASFVYDSPASTDINHDFLFREGITLQRQETYTPRLISIDFKSNLHTLPTDGSLYSPHQPELSTSQASWDGPVELIRQLAVNKNEFLRDLEQEEALHYLPTDEDKDICIDDKTPDGKVSTSAPGSLQKVYDLQNHVTVWSDYLRPHLHPSTVFLLDDNHMINGNLSTEGSWGFNSGCSFWQREEVEDGITDRIRIFAESCGSLQGFQVISDFHDGMGGISNGILAHLEDEYRSKDYLTIAVMPPHLLPETQQLKLLVQSSIIQAYTMCSSLSSMLLPLSLRQQCLDFEAPYITFPHLSLKEDIAYLSSSVLASFIDTATLAYRLKTTPLPLRNITELLTFYNRPIVGSTISLPLGLSSNQYLMEWLYKGNQPCHVPLSPSMDIKTDPFSEMTVVRGIPSSRLIRPDSKLTHGKQYNTANALYHDYLQESSKSPHKCVVLGARDPLNTSSPFPSIFRSSVSEDGFVDFQNQSSDKIVKSLPCTASFHQGGGIGYFVQELLNAAEKTDIGKIPCLLDEGVDKEAWTHMKEQLRKLLGNYITKFEIDSSDDDC
ncbi:protein misato homolog 1 [Palaemon carinicauda]|uniref:protein misato homolog 1 n=1 Tax=Palaemon carinicauda TaxID=392227 RepID=UPI0035B64981